MQIRMGLQVIHKDNKQIKDAKIWHLRLGHLPFNKLTHIFPDMDRHGLEDKFFCTICPLARQARAAINKVVYKLARVFK